MVWVRWVWYLFAQTISAYISCIIQKIKSWVYHIDIMFYLVFLSFPNVRRSCPVSGRLPPNARVVKLAIDQACSNKNQVSFNAKKDQILTGRNSQPTSHDDDVSPKPTWILLSCIDASAMPRIALEHSAFPTWLEGNTQSTLIANQPAISLKPILMPARNCAWAFILRNVTNID